MTRRKVHRSQIEPHRDGYGVVLVTNSYVFMGLPLHILLVHVLVVLGPLTALAVLLHAFWPAARPRLGFVTPLAALVLLVITPIAVDAGEALEEHVTITPAVADHVVLGQTLLPWSIALFVVALALYGVHGYLLRGPLAARVTPALRWGATVVLWGASLAIAGGYLVDVIRIGDAGARAVWGSTYGG